MLGHQWESATGPVATEATATDRRVAAQVANIKSPMPIDLTTKLSWSRAVLALASIGGIAAACALP